MVAIDPALRGAEFPLEALGTLSIELTHLRRLEEARAVLEVGVDDGIRHRRRLVSIGVGERDLDHRSGRVGGHFEPAANRSGGCAIALLAVRRGVAHQVDIETIRRCDQERPVLEILDLGVDDLGVGHLGGTLLFLRRELDVGAVPDEAR